MRAQPTFTPQGGSAQAAQAMARIRHGLFMAAHRNPNTPQPILSPHRVELAALWWSIDGNGYSYRRSKGSRGNQKPFKLHRLVLSSKIGRGLLPNECCDHINGNRLDNRDENLRLVTYQQNSENQHHADGLRGVCFDKQTGKWKARVVHKGKQYHCGFHDDKYSAAAACEAKRCELGFLSHIT